MEEEKTWKYCLLQWICTNILLKSSQREHGTKNETIFPLWRSLMVLSSFSFFSWMALNGHFMLLLLREREISFGTISAGNKISAAVPSPLFSVSAVQSSPPSLLMARKRPKRSPPFPFPPHSMQPTVGAKLGSHPHPLSSNLVSPPPRYILLMAICESWRERGKKRRTPSPALNSPEKRHGGAKGSYDSLGDFCCEIVRWRIPLRRPEHIRRRRRIGKEAAAYFTCIFSLSSVFLFRFRS